MGASFLVSLAPDWVAGEAEMAEGSFLTIWHQTTGPKIKDCANHPGSVFLKRPAPGCHLQNFLFRKSWARPGISIFNQHLSQL